MTTGVIKERKRGEEFYSSSKKHALEIAIKKCLAAEYEPLSIQQLLKIRAVEPIPNRIWTHDYTSLTLIATGITPRRHRIHVVASIPHYLTNPKNIRMINTKNYLRNGAAIIPQEEFKELLEREGERDSEGNQLVWVLDQQRVQKAPTDIRIESPHSDTPDIQKLLQHPLTAPLFGDNDLEKKLTNYSWKHKRMYTLAFMRIDAPPQKDVCKDLVTARLIHLGLAGIHCNSDLKGPHRIAGIDITLWNKSSPKVYF